MARSLLCPKCGTLVDDDRRHEAQTGGYFAFLTHAFRSWPETDEFRPQSMEHLRQWALIRTNHVEIPFVHEFTTDMDRQATISFAIGYIHHKQAQGRLIETRINGGQLEMIEATSQKEAKMGHRKFNEVAQDVFDFIKDRTGLDYEIWLQLGKKRRGEQEVK